MADVTVHDNRDRWDKGDVKALRELRWLGYTIAAIALRLGRTPAAVRSKLYRLGKAG